MTEEELWRLFKDSNLYPSKAGKKDTGKVKVPNPARKLFTANLCDPQIPLEDAASMTLEQWRSKWPLAKWSLFYHEYIVPLARLSRLLRQTTTTRATDQLALELANKYVRGMRLVFGVDFLHHKTIIHRMYHLLTQPKGK